MNIFPLELRTLHLRSPHGTSLLLAGMIFTLFTGCNKPPAAVSPPTVEVTAVTVIPQDTPVEFEFVAQTQSSREVEIRARVEGFLEKRLYTEGEVVKVGQKMFQMDRKPFEAALQSAKGQLAQQQARLSVAEATLARVRPLTEKNALSKKDLDDAVGQQQQAQAAVFAAQGEVQTAKLNLSYTTLSSPLAGLSSFAKKQEGSFLAPGEGGLLTYVAQLDPIWVNFSISENELLKFRDEIAKGRLKFPPRSLFEVEVSLADGSVFPNLGRISFAEPSFSKETGTFLVRTELANPKGELRPGQFVRAHVKGAVRPNGILIPQRAVLQGAKGHYVWIIDKDGKAEKRDVETGDWQGDDWFISQGLNAGERIVVDGAIRVSPGVALKVVATPTTTGATIPADAVKSSPNEMLNSSPEQEESQPKPPSSSEKPAD